VFEHTGPDPVLYVLATVSLQHHRVDAVPVQQMRED
jgi:hypothetical protein